jgi:hypothetical protein
MKIIDEYYFETENLGGSSLVLRDILILPKLEDNFDCAIVQ